MSTKHERRKMILVVDDEAPIRDLLRDALDDEGYGVVVAEDGVAAVRVIRQTIPDLVLTDIMMPRMDGLALCEYLRSNQRTADIPIVGMSAVQFAQYHSLFSAFLIKPFPLIELFTQLERLIGMP